MVIVFLLSSTFNEKRLEESPLLNHILHAKTFKDWLCIRFKLCTRGQLLCIWYSTVFDFGSDFTAFALPSFIEYERTEDFLVSKFDNIHIYISTLWIFMTSFFLTYGTDQKC